MRGLYLKIKKRWLFLSSILIFILVFFLLRGPYLSNSIKRVLIPLLENATGERVITDDAVINLIPFYIQIKSIRVLDKDGNRLLWVTRMRAYLDPFALLHDEIRVKRLSLKEPNLTASREDIQRIKENIQNYLSDTERGHAFTIKGIKVTDGEFELKGFGRFQNISGKGLVVNGAVKDALILDWSLGEGRIKIDGSSEDGYKMTGRARVREGGEIDLVSLDVDYSGSKLNAEGRLTFSADGSFKEGRLKGKATVSTATISRLFKVEGKEGSVRVSGNVDILPKGNGELPRFLFDLKTSGDFYLEDLMRLLKADDRIKGRLFVNGTIKGEYPRITGRWTARLEDALFDTLPMDDVRGEIVYEDKRFVLNDFIAHTYGGEIRGDASLLLPQGDYLVDADATGINSTEFFKFIRWDAPFSEGIINGRFKLKKLRGEDFDITAQVRYINNRITEEGPINRLKIITGGIDFKKRVVGIRDARFSTASSQLFMNGNVDLLNKTLSLDLILASNDASELLSYTHGRMRFEGMAKGKNENPEISGSIRMVSGDLKGIPFDSLRSEITYTIHSLMINSLNITRDNARYEVGGSILFRGAKGLFSFNDPYLDIKVLMRDGDSRTLIKTLYKDIDIGGFVDGLISFKGDSNRYTGKGGLQIKQARLFGENLDRIDLEMSFNEKALNLLSVVLKKGLTELKGTGGVYPDDSFKIHLTSNRLRLDDIGFIKRYDLTGITEDVRIDAGGRFNNPVIDLHMRLHDCNLHGISIKDGVIEAKMNEQHILHLNAALFKERLILVGKAIFKEDGRTAWNLDMDFKKAEYGMAMKGLLRDVPDELSLELEGRVTLSGEGKNLTSMQARVRYLTLGLGDHNLTNKGDILLTLEDGRLLIRSFLLTGPDSDVLVTGKVDIGRGYDIKIKGHMDVAMMGMVIKRLPSLKGKGDYLIDITGDWDEPDISGEVYIKDVTVSTKDLPYTIGSLSGRLILKKDRAIIESLHGAVAGGRVEVSGVGYLERFSLKRAFATLTFNDITITHLDGIKVVLDGRLSYDTSRGGSIITGDIDIKRARYERNVEWKRWLLGLKENMVEPVEQPDILKNSSINIHLSGSRDITIDNNILNAPIGVDLTLTGTTRRYGLIGSVRMIGGSIYFRNNEFEIINGRVDFVSTNEIKPIFNIKAETSTGGYRVRLSLEGPLEKPLLLLSSEPHLSDNEILTLLAVGRTGKDEKGLESGLATSEATALLAGGVEGLIGEGLKGVIGIDRFEITPQGSSTGAVTPKITVGKRILSDKLSVSYTTSIGTTEESLIKLRYRLNKDISIVGVRDETGDVGVDIHYKFKFR